MSVTIERRPASIRREVSAAWRSRQLIPRLAARVIVKTYVKTILGRAWLVLRPVMDSLGLALLFGAVIGLEAPGGTPYLLFLLIGLYGWRLFERSLFWATRSFDRYARIVRKLNPPLLLMPIAGAGPAIVESAVYAALIVGMLGFYAITDGTLYLVVGPGLLLGVAGIALCLWFALALGLTLSVLNARARDVRIGLRYVLSIWFYVTPVIYPLSKLPELFQVLAQINPVTPMIELIKEGFLGIGRVDPLGVAWAVAATAGATAFGLWFFSRKAADFTTPSESGMIADDEEDDIL
jgi:lipopolysaccharide transport system permease protein